MERLMKVTLYANASIAGLIGIFSYGLQLLPADPFAAQSAPLARNVGAWEVSFALACLVIARNLPRDPRWLLVTIPFFLVLLAQSTYELLATPGAPPQPVVVRTVFLTLYVIGYLRLTNRRRALATG